MRIKHLISSLSAVALAFTVLSCSDKIVTPNSLMTPNAASHEAVASGPMVPGFVAPLGTTAATPATFDATAVTRIDVCVWTGTACTGPLVAQFTITPTGSALPLTANTATGEFEASWSLLSTSLSTRQTYRIRAFGGTSSSVAGSLGGPVEVAAVSVDVVRGKWALTKTDGSLAPLVAAVSLPIRVFVPQPPALKINEVESSGGFPDDWVEFYNAGTTTIDLSGWVFKDNDDSHKLTIPAGTTIAAGALIVFDDVSSSPALPNQFNFGLGSSDMARIWTPWGRLVDSYTWTAHATTTYGRCPNGAGPFVTTTSSTKGLPNDCSVNVKINEVESSGGTPGDWVELINNGSTTVDLSGFKFKDNDDTHAFYVLPAGSTIAPGGYLVLNEADFVFGLGAADAARLFYPDGVTLVDSFSWTAHAATTYGRCPNGTGAFATTTSSTKGAANDCSKPSDIKINEIESSGGTPGDWVELYNSGANAVDASGLKLKDSDDSHAFYVIPTGTIIPSHGFLVIEESQFLFGLGAPDAVRLFATDGVTLLDSYSWTTHAVVTYGRCPDGTGAFVDTKASTKGAANSCGTLTPPTTEPWPGGDFIGTVDGSNVFGTNLSGLIYEAAIGGSPDVLWGVRNGPSTIFRLIFDGSIWTPDPSNDWGAGKTIFYTDGTGGPDSEDLTFTTGSSAGMYVSTERDNNDGSVSRPAILRYDITASGTSLTATNDWNLTSEFPGIPANSGIEAVSWIPDTYLTAKSFFDDHAGHLYNPADYPNHGSGLFFLGLEADGVIYVYALNHATNGFQRITSISTGFPAGVMALRFDGELGQLWATCDDTCHGLSDIFIINALGKLQLTHIFSRPPSMPDTNNEGFTMTPQSKCVGGLKPAYWSDDNNLGGHAIRQASVPCVAFSIP
jgi:hypothetical protein